MAKFDVYALAQGRGYLIDCQANLLSDLNTRFVVPLLPLEEAPKPAARLNPVFDIAGEPHVMVTQFAGPCRSTSFRQERHRSPNKRSLSAMPWTC
jgi:toxin CcdB